jgi:outer membrane biosynthesis protein TonB
MSANQIQTQTNNNNANTSYKFKTRKTIELLGQTFEEFASSFPPESTIVAVLHAWNLLQSNLANGIVKESKSTNPKTSDYQLFGKWLKLNNDTYTALSISEFSKLQSSLWKQSTEKEDFLNLSEEEKHKIMEAPKPTNDKPSKKPTDVKPTDDKKEDKKEVKQDKPIKSKSDKPKKTKSDKPSDSDKPTDKPKKSKSKTDKPIPSHDDTNEISDADFD